MVAAISKPRRSLLTAFTAIVQEKVMTIQGAGLGAVCFAFFIFVATVYCLKNKDDLFNRVQKQATFHRVPGTVSGQLHPTIEDVKLEDRDVEKSNHSEDIAEFWKKLVQAPREVQCANVTCKSQPFPPESSLPSPNSNASTCPLYFQWIFEDLAPWLQDGISLELLEKAKKAASFRVIIRGGRLFIEPYDECYQTRSLFTIWGLVQLLDYYPGLVPDVDLMFSCKDRPVMRKSARGIPPPVFRYCSTKDFWDIPFPDWSFWGWSEINIAPWDQELSNIVKASKKTTWVDRNPTAYWKGNPYVAPIRRELLKCNSSDYGAQIYIQDWIKEGANGFPNSKLADQCHHRYKIYVEGWAWSVSMKYILACNSPSLLITPAFHDFFTRGLVPRVSYWPVRYKKMCESIKFAVEWGNSNPAQAQRIGQAGQNFMEQEVSMERVYDYMLHVLREYAKLLRFKPEEGVGAREVCKEEMLCSAQAVEKRFMERSMVMRRDSSSAACKLERGGAGIAEVVRTQRKHIRQTEKWEDSAASMRKASAD